MIGRILLNVAMGGLAGLVITGCATAKRQVARPAPRPLGARYVTEANAGREGEPLATDVALPDGTLKLEQALGAALLHNPSLVAFSYDVRAAEARALQAGVLRNPKLEIEVEEYDRGGEEFGSAETAVVLGQVFELGGKRRWRTRVAEAEGELAGWDYESKRLDVFSETAQRFTAVIAAQERVELTDTAMGLAENTSRAVGERVKAGIEPPLQASKSEAELEMARMDAQEAAVALGVARKRLAAMWGAEADAFDTAEGSLDRDLRTVPSLETLRARLGANPDLARWEAELRLRSAAVASERAGRVPNLEASVGYRQFEEDGTDALAFGVGIPLPLFDRNRGNITAAQHELAKAESERRATELALAAALAEAHADLSAAHQRVLTLQTRVVPTMERAYQAAHEGYRQGKFGFLDMLDAQRGLFEARKALVDALYGYQAALIAIQRITSAPVDELMTEGEEN